MLQKKNIKQENAFTDPVYQQGSSLADLGFYLPCRDQDQISPIT